MAIFRLFRLVLLTSLTLFAFASRGASPILDEYRLTPDEIQAASDALKKIWSNEPLPTITQGGTEPRGLVPLRRRFARFNTPFVAESDRVESTYAFQCSDNGGWRCSGPYTQFRIIAGIPHVFGKPANMELKTIVEIVDYLNSACFGSQLKQMSKPGQTIHYGGIGSMQRHQDGFSISFTGTIGGLSVYIVPTDLADDGCMFKLVGHGMWIS